MPRLDDVDLDDVVEVAVDLPEFGAAEPPEPRQTPHWQVTMLRAAGVVACFVVATAAGVLGSERATITGPTTTVTVSPIVETPVPFDPLGGVITSGRWRVGEQVRPGAYWVMPDAQSQQCVWTIHQRRAGTIWRTNRTQTTALVTGVELASGDEIESLGCHWRFRV